MKREIYIMEQRLQNLKKEQKRKIEEMEKQVDHRDVLRTKGQAVQAATSSGQKGKTKATLLRGAGPVPLLPPQKENARLVAELRARKAEAQKRDQQIKDCLGNTERTALEVEKVNQEAEELTKQLQELQASINQKAAERARAGDEKVRKTRTLQRYLEAHKQPPLYQPQFQQDQVVQQGELLEDRKQDIGRIIQELSVMFPQYASQLQDIVVDL